MNAHHDGSARYLSEAAPVLGSKVAHGCACRQGWGSDVRARSVGDGEPHYTVATVSETEPGDEGATWWEGHVTVTNPVTPYRFLLETPAGPCWVNGRGTHSYDVADRDDFVVSTFDAPPGWLADAVGYQIFPDRFARTEASRSAPPVPAGEWAIESDWDAPVDADWRRSASAVPRRPRRNPRAPRPRRRARGQPALPQPDLPGRSSHRYDASDVRPLDPVLG